MKRPLLDLLRFALPALLGLPALAQVPNGTAIEYYNTGLRHYFLATDPAEFAVLDGGAAGPGWIRTGGQFSIFRNPGDAPGLSAVCRFYGTPGKGPNSHFYTADPGECATVGNDPGWMFEKVAFYAFRPQDGACARSTEPVYRSYNNGAPRNDTNHRFTVDATVWARSASDGHIPETIAMCAPLSAADIEADAVRLLRQATFGPTESELARVMSRGATGWIDGQLAAPTTPYPDYPWTPNGAPQTCVDDRTQPLRPDSYCFRDNYTLFQLQLQFFRDAASGDDQLRQRVAFALSQIFVTSGVDVSRNYAMRHYQQLFRDRAFGNFYDLMLAVTLSPVMGDYLDMANNNKGNPASNIEPNENYAREILQLFTVGTYLLNPDGTYRLGADGKPIPTYDQDEIEGFAHVFTGWTYPTVVGQANRNNNPRNYDGPLRAVDANHDFGTKALLMNVLAPAGLSMTQDLAFAHENVFSHPNVGPFIGRQLIQKLVTSEPTPAYVSRISAVFANNGAGQRGDLRAVARAILTDPEARGARKIDPAYGKLTEPVLFLTSMLRGLDGWTDGVFFRTGAAGLGQNVFYSPTVFNYFPPDYRVPGTNLLGPEFGIQTTSTAINRANVVNTLVYSNGIARDASVYGSTGSQVNLAAYQAVAGDAGALADRFNRLLMAGRMSAAMRSAIVSAVNAVPVTDTLNRARAAAYLVLSSPQFQVER